MKKQIVTITKVGSIVFVFLIAAQFIPANLFNFWDFRNNLWGPSHLLVTGRSPYFIKQLFPWTNAVWMPQILGISFPFGLLDFSLASKIWLLLSISAVGLIIYLSFQRSIRPWKFAGMLLLIFVFPPLILHISLGQVSLFITLFLMLAVLKGDSLFWKSFFCVLALVKPQLCFLPLPGIFIMTYRTHKISGVFSLVAAMAAWAALALVPLFVMFPNWISDFIAALLDNAPWIQPSLRFSLSSWLSPTPGLIIWMILTVVVFFINGWLWYRLDPHQALAWSLSLTCLVSPYIWSWDFVFLLPCFLYLMLQSAQKTVTWLLILGFIIGSLLMWKTRWNTQVSDEVFFWVPAYFLSIFLFASYCLRRQGNRKGESVGIENAV